MSTDDELDGIRARMADSDFWFGEYSIPQYELLVREALLTQAEADDYRAQRVEMGLPMTFAELESAPHEAFRWVKAAGGPSLEPEQDFERAGVRWRSEIFVDKGRVRTFDRNPKGDPKGYMAREIKAAWDGNGIVWEASFQVSEHVFASRSNRAATFDEAIAAVLAVDFEPTEIAGHRWYVSTFGAEPGWIADVDGARIELSPRAGGAAGGPSWWWERGLDQGSPAHAMAKLFGGYQMRGEAPTREAAASDAIAAPSRLLGLAGDLMGDDKFEAGRKAGIGASLAALRAL